MTDTKKLLNELSKLTRREQEYLVQLIKNRTGNRDADMRVLEFDIDMYRFNAIAMRRTFQLMYGLNETEVQKLSKRYSL